MPNDEVTFPVPDRATVFDFGGRWGSDASAQ